MNRLSIDIPFFVWLVTYASCLGIQDYGFALPSINVQSTLYKHGILKIVVVKFRFILLINPLRFLLSISK